MDSGNGDNNFSGCVGSGLVEDGVAVGPVEVREVEREAGMEEARAEGREEEEKAVEEERGELGKEVLKDIAIIRDKHTGLHRGNGQFMGTIIETIMETYIAT